MVAKRVVEGLTLVLIGVILLLNTTGSLPWSIWLHVLSLWPLLLVAAGLEIVARGVHAEWLRVVSSLLIMAGLVIGAFVLPLGERTPGLDWLWGHEDATFDMREAAHERVSTGAATVRGGVGSYRIVAGDDLVRVSGRTGHSRYRQPGLDVEVAGGKAQVTITGPESERLWIPALRGASQVDVTLSDDVLWDLAFDTGVVDLDADLSGLRVSALELRSSVSQVTITLGAVPIGIEEVPVLVAGGVADFTIRVPRGVPVRVEADTGLVNVSVDRDVPRIEDERRAWMTSGFPGEGGYRIRFDAGVSNARVVTY
ncbi:MAG TPA: DUF5668 domain-containing protein [Coriobacteriia bacterium]|nr:DUF5668 domain-containing protein [Coriobacteriia bacterium]